MPKAKVVRTLREVRARLHEVEHEAAELRRELRMIAHAAGRPMANARQPRRARRSDNGANPDLTRRELEILRLIGEGEDTKMVANRLHVSPATIRNHVQNILGKLAVHTRLQAVAYARAHRIL